MEFCTARYETTEIDSIDDLIAYLRSAQQRDGDIYGIMITPPDTYSQGKFWLRKVDNYQYSAMEA